MFGLFQREKAIKFLSFPLISLSDKLCAGSKAARGTVAVVRTVEQCSDTVVVAVNHSYKSLFISSLDLVVWWLTGSSLAGLLISVATRLVLVVVGWWFVVLSPSHTRYRVVDRW